MFDLDLHNKIKYYPTFPTIKLIPLQTIEAPINWRLGSVELLVLAKERL